MNADNKPTEIASYIIRQTETVNANREQKKRTLAGKYIACIAGALIVLVLVCSRFGIEKKAAAFENDAAENVAVTTLAEESVAEPDSDAESKTYADESLKDEIKNEAETVAATDEDGADIIIPDGATLLEYMAKQEVGAEYEENISGLLWNYELIADIRNRAETAEAEEQLREEEYRELLETMGIPENYTSQNPELPEYLTKTYNPLMDIELSEEEAFTLMRLVEAEAPAEDIYGKILVANVVLNRVNNESMADTVTGVIYEKIGGNTQFSPTAISWYWNSIVVTDSTREAVARCLSGEDYSDGALYFYAWEKNPNKHKTVEWMKELDYLFTHGGHRFFR